MKCCFKSLRKESNDRDLPSNTSSCCFLLVCNAAAGGGADPKDPLEANDTTLPGKWLYGSLRWMCVCVHHVSEYFGGVVKLSSYLAQWILQPDVENHPHLLRVYVQSRQGLLIPPSYAAIPLPW